MIEMNFRVTSAEDARIAASVCQHAAALLSGTATVSEATTETPAQRTSRKSRTAPAVVVAEAEPVLVVAEAEETQTCNVADALRAELAQTRGAAWIAAMNSRYTAVGYDALSVAELNALAAESWTDPRETAEPARSDEDFRNDLRALGHKHGVIWMRDEVLKKYGVVKLSDLPIAAVKEVVARG